MGMRGAGRLGRLAELARTDSFIARVLGTDCYTAALAAVNGDCRSLGHEQKTRLALAFSNCHLSKLGKKTYACTARMSVQQCVDHDDTVCLKCTPCCRQMPCVLIYAHLARSMPSDAGVFHHPHAVLCGGRQVRV